MITDYELTSLEFISILQQLPNPMYYCDKILKGDLPIYKVAYLPNPVNQETTYLATPNSKPQKMLGVKEIEFELIPNNNIWFWQPVKPVRIVRIEKKEGYRKNW